MVAICLHGQTGFAVMERTRVVSVRRSLSGCRRAHGLALSNALEAPSVRSVRRAATSIDHMGDFNSRI